MMASWPKRCVLKQSKSKKCTKQEDKCTFSYPVHNDFVVTSFFTLIVV